MAGKRNLTKRYDRYVKSLEAPKISKEFPSLGLEFEHCENRTKTYQIMSITPTAIDEMFKRHPGGAFDALNYAPQIPHAIFSFTYSIDSGMYTYVWPFRNALELGWYIQTVRDTYVMCGSDLLPNTRLKEPEDFDDYEEPKEKKKNDVVIDFKTAKKRIEKKRALSSPLFLFCFR